MANLLDVPRIEADEILSSKKIAPFQDFRPVSAGKAGGVEKWESAVGVSTDKGLYKKALTVELLCQQSLRPHRRNFKFSLFLSEYGMKRRVYQLDTTSVPISDQGEHDWPHEHVGQDKVFFAENYPCNFDDAIAHFRQKTNIAFADTVESPFEFRLKS